MPERFDKPILIVFFVHSVKIFLKYDILTEQNWEARKTGRKLSLEKKASQMGKCLEAMVSF